MWGPRPSVHLFVFELLWEIKDFFRIVMKFGRLRLKCDGTRAETRFRLSAKRTSPFKSRGGARQFSRLLAAEVCASAVVMLDTPCSEVVWRVLATHCIRQFPLYFPSRAWPCSITFQLYSVGVGYEKLVDQTSVALNISLVIPYFARGIKWHFYW